MDIPIAWFWAILAVALCIGEMINLSFFMLPFAIGCVAAAIASLFGVELAWQIAIVAVVGVACLLIMRPFAKRVTRPEPQKSGINRLIGKEAVITAAIEPGASGKARVGTEDWLAKAADPKTAMAQGSTAVVESVDGVHVVVVPRPQSKEQ